MGFYTARHGYIRLCLAVTALLATVAICHADKVTVSFTTSGATAPYCDPIASAYSQMNEAFITNCIDRSAAFMTDDYRQVDPQGHTLDKTGTCKKFQWERKQISTIQSQCSINSMTQCPDGVQVVMTTHSSGTGFKRVLFMNVKGVFTNDLRVVDVWVSTPTGWRLKSRKMLQDESHTSAA